MILGESATLVWKMLSGGVCGRVFICALTVYRYSLGAFHL